MMELTFGKGDQLGLPSCLRPVYGGIDRQRFDYQHSPSSSSRTVGNSFGDGRPAHSAFASNKTESSPANHGRTRQTLT